MEQHMKSCRWFILFLLLSCSFIISVDNSFYLKTWESIDKHYRYCLNNLSEEDTLRLKQMVNDLEIGDIFLIEPIIDDDIIYFRLLIGTEIMIIPTLASALVDTSEEDLAKKDKVD